VTAELALRDGYAAETMPPPDAHDLPDRSRSDARAELGRHALKLGAALRHFFRRNGVGPDEQDDLVQETFVRVAASPAIEDCDNIDAYVTRSATRVLIDRQRRRRVRHADAHCEFDAALHAGLASPTDELVIARQALRRTSLLLMELPERTRFVFVLSRMEELSNREIALRLGISISGVEKHMHRAMRYLVANIGNAR
jgi:RNA polymerase sigma factor (sigma-70 family)